MPEIGVVHVARQIAEATLPVYRTRYAKHTFTQPALLAVVCVFIRHELGAMSVIPAKRGKATWQLHGHLGIRAQMRAAFPVVLYRQRAGVESLFSATKRTRAVRASGRSTAIQQRQALLLGVTFNRYRIRLPSVLFCSFALRVSTRPDGL